MNIPCCKIGCCNEAVKCQEIGFRNHHGYLIHTHIGWCKDHKPECIFDEFTQTDLLRDKGY